MGNTPSAPAATTGRRRPAASTPPRHRQGADAKDAACKGDVRFPAATRLPWNPAKAAKLYEFVPATAAASSRSSLVWPIGSKDSETFADELLDSKAKFISARKVTIYFRIGKDQCARRVFSSDSGFSLARLLKLIHSTAMSGAVLALKQGGMTKVCQNHVDAFLKGKVVNRLYLTSSQVYVNIKDGGAR